MQNILILILISFIAFIAIISFVIRQNMKKKNNGRIDIYNTGNPDNTISIVSMSPSIKETDEYNNPEWLPEKGIGKSFTFPAGFSYKEGKIVFKAVGSGKIRIDIMGEYKVKNEETGELEELYIQYEEANINGVDIFISPKLLWHNDRVIYFIPTNSDEEYTLTFKYKTPSSSKKNDEVI